MSARAPTPGPGDTAPRRAPSARARAHARVARTSRRALATIALCVAFTTEVAAQRSDDPFGPAAVAPTEAQPAYPPPGYAPPSYAPPTGYGPAPGYGATGVDPAAGYGIGPMDPMQLDARLTELDTLGRRERIFAGAAGAGIGVFAIGFSVFMVCFPMFGTDQCGDGALVGSATAMTLGAVGMVGGTIGGGVVGLRSGHQLEELGRPARRVLPILSLVGMVPVGPTAALLPVAPILIGLHGRHVRREVAAMRGTPLAGHVRVLALQPTLDAHHGLVAVTIFGTLGAD